MLGLKKGGHAASAFPYALEKNQAFLAPTTNSRESGHFS